MCRVVFARKQHGTVPQKKRRQLCDYTESTTENVFDKNHLRLRYAALQRSNFHKHRLICIIVAAPDNTNGTDFSTRNPRTSTYRARCWLFYIPTASLISPILRNTVLTWWKGNEREIFSLPTDVPRCCSYRLKSESVHEKRCPTCIRHYALAEFRKSVGILEPSFFSE